MYSGAELGRLERRRNWHVAHVCPGTPSANHRIREHLKLEDAPVLHISVTAVIPRQM